MNDNKMTMNAEIDTSFECFGSCWYQKIVRYTFNICIYVLFRRKWYAMLLSTDQSIYPSMRPSIESMPIHASINHLDYITLLIMIIFQCHFLISTESTKLNYTMT
eukprot:74023_1